MTVHSIVGAALALFLVTFRDPSIPAGEATHLVTLPAAFDEDLAAELVAAALERRDGIQRCHGFRAVRVLDIPNPEADHGQKAEEVPEAVAPSGEERPVQEA